MSAAERASEAKGEKNELINISHLDASTTQLISEMSFLAYFQVLYFFNFILLFYRSFECIWYFGFLI